MYEIKNIEQVEKILEENKIYIKDRWIFHKLWRNVDIKDNTNECWDWTAGTYLFGYGQLNYGKSTVAHRLVYMLTKGDIPNGLQVQHLCNNPMCCNPYHLELGTYSKNARYAVKCGRWGSQKLTEDQVRDIHRIYHEQQKLHPGYKLWQILNPIAKKFEVRYLLIWRIIRGDRWHHIYDELRNKGEI